MSDEKTVVPCENCRGSGRVEAPAYTEPRTSMRAQPLPTKRVPCPICIGTGIVPGPVSPT